MASPGARATSRVVGGAELLGMSCSLPTMDKSAYLLVRSTATPRTRRLGALVVAGLQCPCRCEGSQSAAPQCPLSGSPLAVSTSARIYQPLHHPNRHAAIAALACGRGPSQRRRSTQIRTGSRCWSRAAAAARYGRPWRYIRSHALLPRPT